MYPKPEPIRPGQFQLSARDLNWVITAVMRQLSGTGDTSVRMYGDRAVIDSNPVGPTRNDVGNYIAEYVVLEEFDDYLKCAVYRQENDGDDWTQPVYDEERGQDEINIFYVAKPHNLQSSFWNGVTLEVDGDDYTITVADGVRTFTPVSSGTLFTDSLSPAYLAGEIIYAVGGVTGVRDENDNQIGWMDLNSAGRKWERAVSGGSGIDLHNQFGGVTTTSFNGVTDLYAPFEYGLVFTIISGKTVIVGAGATDTYQGMVTTSDQSFAGIKTFVSNRTVFQSSTYSACQLIINPQNLVGGDTTRVAIALDGYSGLKPEVRLEHTAPSGASISRFVLVAPQDATSPGPQYCVMDTAGVRSDGAYAVVGGMTFKGGLYVSGSPTATLADGSYGDITVSGSGTNFQLAANSVGSAEIDNGSVTTSELGGDITAAGKSLLDDATTADQRNTLGLGTADTPQFTGLEIGHATDTTLTRTGAGDLAVEGNVLYRAGGTDVSIADGGTGASTAAGARTNLGLGTGALLVTDTDTTLAANSDSNVPTQKAVKTYVDNAVTGLLDFKGSTDTSANPNYPAANKGDAYVVSVAGRIGGGSGRQVDIGDVYLATADNAGGTEAAVGANWAVLEHNLVGAVIASNNLSDLTNPGTARTNLGLGTVSVLTSDTDVTLAANSDGNVPTQKAVKTYVDAAVAASSGATTEDITALDADSVYYGRVF